MVAAGARANEGESNTVPVSFTFEPQLSITVENASGSTVNTIAIGSMMPGTTAVSENGLKVKVNTNAGAGYTLSASVGRAAADGVTGYSTTSLTGANGEFKSLQSSSSMGDCYVASTSTVANFGENCWGYSTNGTDFAGLPIYTADAKILNKTTKSDGTAASGYAGTANTSFYIGAKAGNMPAGTYQNVVNFSVVANPTSNEASGS